MVSRAALPPCPDRRAVLAGLAALAVHPALGATPAPRLAAIDWAMLETAAAVGHMPVAACELMRFRADAATPTIPAKVVDLGLRGAPNLELLQLLRPGLILSSPFYAAMESRLSQIAPVLSLPFYDPGQPPLPRAFAALTQVAQAVGDPAAGERAAADANARLDRLAQRLRKAAARPFAVVELGDAQHMRVFGDDSLFGSTLARLGLANAFQGATRFSFLAPVPITELAARATARLILIGPPPPEARAALRRSVLWQRLPAVAAGRVHELPVMNGFGAVPAALRFASALADAVGA
ncbi:iron-siderophore ABC transporter substrate-binding protein [Paracoccus sp. p4-l81]|uniref:iron-siderophore ABC transporter substrate-binding protein n=1 Tax=Paracoccus sp. p4-l81 TaxID=3342806 RepID=UPI0035B7489B